MIMNKLMRATAKLRVKLTFAAWSKLNAAAYILPLGLNAEMVAWIVSVMQSGGEMQGISDYHTFRKNLELRRTKLRWPTDLDRERVLLTGKMLWKTYRNGVGK